jgi:hypothetical protein
MRLPVRPRGWRDASLGARSVRKKQGLESSSEAFSRIGSTRFSPNGAKRPTTANARRYGYFTIFDAF